MILRIVVGVLLASVLTRCVDGLAAGSPSSGNVNRKAVLTRAAISFVKERDPVASLKFYDMLPPSPYLWQRGLVAYCAGEFKVAASQFDFDRSVNGGDGEEALWMCASLARLKGSSKADLLSSLPPNGLVANDPRPVIRDSVKLFYDFLSGNVADNFAAKFLTGQASDDKTTFYADLYLGLFYDSLSPNPTLASSYLSKALATPYAKQGSDFMISTAENVQNMDAQ